MRKKLFRFAVALFAFAVAATASSKPALAFDGCPSPTSLWIWDGFGWDGEYECVESIDSGSSCSTCVYDCGSLANSMYGTSLHGFIPVNMCQS